MIGAMFLFSIFRCSISIFIFILYFPFSTCQVYVLRVRVLLAYYRNAEHWGRAILLE